MYRLWLWIKGNPLTYKLYLNFKGTYNSKLFPNKTTDIHIAGYQRTGNTFCKKILDRLAPNYNVATHVHSIATIKLALKHNVPTLVLIRDPKNCITSSIVKSRSKGASELWAMKALTEYVIYYQYVLSHQKYLIICDFLTLKNEPKKLVHTMVNLLGLSFSDSIVEKSIDDAVLDIKSKKGVLEARGQLGDFGWKSDEKEKLKKEVFESIKHTSEYKKAVALYEKILKINSVLV